MLTSLPGRPSVDDNELCIGISEASDHSLLFRTTHHSADLSIRRMGSFREAFGNHHKEEPLPPPSFEQATSSSSSEFKPLPRPGGSASFACLLLSSQDKIRTVNFPEHAIPPIQEAITRVWAAGIQQQSWTTPQNYEWKLKGNPCAPPLPRIGESRGNVKADSGVRVWIIIGSDLGEAIDPTHHPQPRSARMACPSFRRLDEKDIR